MNQKLGDCVIFMSMHLLLEVSAYILRLPCKTIAQFTVKRTHTSLQNLGPVATFEAVNIPTCMRECTFYDNCKSFVITNEDTCLLFSKSYEDKKDNVSISEQPGYTYYSTVFNDTKIGPNCKARSPCAAGKICFDTCECPGYKCVGIDNCIGSPCKNGGTCRSTSNGYQCSCIDGFEGDNCGFASIQWHSQCGPNTIMPNSIQLRQDLCYLDCIKGNFEVAFYRKSSLSCFCRGSIGYDQSAMDTECSFLPNVGTSWQPKCSYTGGTYYKEVISKWHCYYFCKDLSFKSATWFQSQQKCFCQFSEGKGVNLLSECIAL